MKKKILAYALSIFMAVIIGLQFILIKKALVYFEGHELMLLSLRFLCALLLYAVLLLFVKVKGSPFTLTELKKHLFDKKILLLCVLTPFLNLLMQTYGTKLSAVAVIAYISACGPFIALLADALIKKKTIDKKQLFFTFLCVGGAVLSVSGNSSEREFSIAGFLLIVAALILRSLYAGLFQKNRLTEFSPFLVTFCQLFWGSVLFTVSALLKGEYANGLLVVGNILANDWFSFFYISFFSIAVLYTLNNVCLGSLPNVSIAITNNLTFVITLASSVLSENERLSAKSMIGAAVIILCVIFGYPKKKET